MNKSILLVLALCAFIATEGKRGGERGQGAGGISKHRGEFNMDPKLCFPKMKGLRRCCAMPSLIDETAKDACEALYRPPGAASSSQENGHQSGGNDGDDDDQGAAPQRQRAGEMRGQNRGGSRRGRAADGQRRRGQNERMHENRGGRQEGGQHEKFSTEICEMDCYFSNSSFYTASGSIDPAKVLTAFLARLNTTQQNWTSVVTTAVNDCSANLTALTPKPTPPPAANIACKLDATLFMGCVKRYLALNCQTPITPINGNSCNTTALQNCDPYYIPSGPPPGQNGAPMRGRVHSAKTGSGNRKGHAKTQ